MWVCHLVDAVRSLASVAAGYVAHHAPYHHALSCQAEAVTGEAHYVIKLTVGAPLAP